MNSQLPPRISMSTGRMGAGASNSQGSFTYSHSHSNTNDGYYIPPASELTSSNHDKALEVTNAAHKQTDHERDMKALGDNTDEHTDGIFQELNKIRKKQLALAAKHISIETVADDDKSLASDGKPLDAADKDELDPLHFARKGQELQDLMASLEDLGRSMSDFHELSNSMKKLPPSSSHPLRK